MEKICDKVLRKIKDEKICPKPRWHFLLKDCFIWFFFLVSLGIGAIAFSLIIHIFLTNDWFLYRYLHTTFFGHVLISIPYIWLIILILFIAIAYYNFKYTKTGYRHEIYLIVVLSFIGSLLLGAFIHTLGVAEKIENVVAVNLPVYEKMMCCSSRTDIWDQPENGLLGGQIIKIIDKQNFELEDFQGLRWDVYENGDTVRFNPVRIIKGEKVKIIGEKEGEHVFWAKEIRIWSHPAFGDIGEEFED